MSLDMHAVGTALADKFGNVTAPTGTMGGTAIRSESVGVHGIPLTPAIVVELPEGEVESEMPGDRRIHHDFHVYFLFQKASGDVPRDTAVMLQWLGPLLDALESGNTLSLGSEDGWNVLKTRTVSWEPGNYSVEGDEYHAWHLITRVWTWDNLTVSV